MKKHSVSHNTFHSTFHNTDWAPIRSWEIAPYPFWRGCADCPWDLMPPDTQRDFTRLARWAGLREWPKVPLPPLRGARTFDLTPMPGLGAKPDDK